MPWVALRKPPRLRSHQDSLLWEEYKNDRSCARKQRILWEWHLLVPLKYIIISSAIIIIIIVGGQSRRKSWTSPEISWRSQRIKPKRHCAAPCRPCGDLVFVKRIKININIVGQWGDQTASNKEAGHRIHRWSQESRGFLAICGRIYSIDVRVRHRWWCPWRWKWDGDQRQPHPRWGPLESSCCPWRFQWCPASPHYRSFLKSQQYPLWRISHA